VDGYYDVGDQVAQLRGNGTGLAPPPFTLFASASHVDAAWAPDMRVGVALARTLAVEAGVMLSAPHIGVSISKDVEAASQELPGEALRQFQVDGAVVWQLPIHGRRIAPFAMGGAGYVRQLHEDRMLGETGQVYFGGGGLRYWIRGGAASRSFGLRAEARIMHRRGGIDFANAGRTYPSVSLALFAGL